MATLWRTENFSSGIHTKPARLEGGERYARDIENLRITHNGFMKLRGGFKPIGGSGPDITGIAATTRYLLLLRSDGYLYIRDINNLNAESRIANIDPATAGLSGRISLASTAPDYLIVTSEGDDLGFWIDLNEQSTTFKHAFQLGLDVPHAAQIAAIGHTTTGTGFSGDGWLRYRLTWLRNAPGEPFDGAESSPSGTVDVNVIGGGRININNIQFPTDPQVTHLAIYRNRELVPEQSDLTLNAADLHRIATVSRENRSVGYIDDNSADFDNGVEIELFNNRLPPGVKQIHFHQKRIFAAAGSKLVYSAFDNLTPQYWRFTPTNSQRRPDAGDITFCASHREVLLFGAQDGLFRLDGTDNFDFQVDQISGAGPRDGYSWGVFENTLGFVSGRGFHVTDASNTDLVSDESLDQFFTGQRIERGLVGFFSDNTLIFSVILRPINGGDTKQSYFLFDDRHWTKWSAANVLQFATIDGQVYIAGSDRLHRIKWEEGDNTDTALDWAYESNLIDGDAYGIQSDLKRFTELYINAAAGSRIVLKTWKDDDEMPVEQAFTTRDSTDSNVQTVLIERIARRLRFRLEGVGPVTIRGLRLEGNAEKRI